MKPCKKDKHDFEQVSSYRDAWDGMTIIAMKWCNKCGSVCIDEIREEKIKNGKVKSPSYKN